MKLTTPTYSDLDHLVHGVGRHVGRDLLYRLYADRRRGAAGHRLLTERLSEDENNAVYASEPGVAASSSTRARTASWRRSLPRSTRTRTAGSSIAYVSGDTAGLLSSRVGTLCTLLNLT